MRRFIQFFNINNPEEPDYDFDIMMLCVYAPSLGLVLGLLIGVIVSHI